MSPARSRPRAATGRSDLTLDAPLSITNALTLEAGGGGITEDANGSITAATLSGGGATIGGDVSLASTANSIGALADFITERHACPDPCG